MSKSKSRAAKASAASQGGFQHSQSLASDWTFCEYYVPSQPAVAPAPKFNIWGRLVSR